MRNIPLAMATMLAAISPAAAFQEDHEALGKPADGRALLKSVRSVPPVVLPRFAVRPFEATRVRDARAFTPDDVPARRARRHLDESLLDLAEEIERNAFDMEDLEVVGQMIAQWAFTHQPEYPRMCTLRQRLLDEVARLEERARNAYLSRADVRELETHIWDADIERLTSQLQWRIRERGGDAELYAELVQAIQRRMVSAAGIDQEAAQISAALESAVDELVASATVETRLWEKLAYEVLQAKIHYALAELESHARAFGASRSDYERLQRLWIDRARMQAGQPLPDCE
jgi:hypothetical protein